MMTKIFQGICLSQLCLFQSFDHISSDSWSLKYFVMFSMKISLTLMFSSSFPCSFRVSLMSLLSFFNDAKSFLTPSRLTFTIGVAPPFFCLGTQPSARLPNSQTVDTMGPAGGGHRLAIFPVIAIVFPSTSLFLLKEY